MSVPTPSYQQIQNALLKAFTDKHDAEAKVKEAELQITALRNLLNGYALASQPAEPTPPTP